MDNSLKQQLKQRFTPVGSLARRHQIRMLEILDAVDRICRKHQIPYWLSSGTLLGAIRHQGFIPWDDDLDIELIREDYIRLMKILPKELPEHMALQTHETDPNYILPYAKVRDLNSYMEELCPYDQTWKYRGIYIDIFPLEPVPYPFAWLGEHLQGRIYNQFNRKKLPIEELKKQVQKIYRFNERYCFPFLRKLIKLFPVKAYRQSLGSCYHAPRYVKELFPLEMAEFEGKFFPVPHDSNSVLWRCYGNYTVIPDVDELHPHYSKLEIYK